MNTSYECRACHWQFSSPPREACVICDSRQLDKIAPLAPPWEVTGKPLSMQVAMDAADYADLTDEQRVEFAGQVERIDGSRVLEIVRRTVAGMGAEQPVQVKGE